MMEKMVHRSLMLVPVQTSVLERYTRQTVVCQLWTQKKDNFSNVALHRQSLQVRVQLLTSALRSMLVMSLHVIAMHLVYTYIQLFRNTFTYIWRLPEVWILQTKFLTTGTMRYCRLCYADSGHK